MESIALIFYLKKVAGEGKEITIWMNREEKGQKKKKEITTRTTTTKKTRRTTVRKLGF